MKRPGRWWKRTLAAIIVLVVLAGAAYLLRWPLLGGTIRAAVRDVAADYGLSVRVDGFSGSLFGDVTVHGVVASPATDSHLVREASVERIHATFSLRGLLGGDDRWLRTVEIEGVRAVVDVQGRIPSPTPSGTEEGSGTAVIPTSVTLTNADLTVLAGKSRLEILGGCVDVREVADLDWKGHACADVVRTILEGDTEEYEKPTAEVQYVAGGLSVVTGGTREVIRADVSRIEDGFVEGDVDLPLLGGTITGHVRTDVETDTVTATLVLAEIRAAPLLRFLPDLPVGLDQVSGNLTATLARASDPDVGGLSASFDFLFTRPRVDRWAAERVKLEGTLEDRVLTFEGRTAGPESGVSGTLWLEETLRFKASVLLERFDLGFLALEIEDRDIRGVATGRASIEGTAAAPVFSADLEIVSPGYGEWSADRIDVKGSGSADGFTVENFRADRGADHVTANGTVTFGESVTFTAEGDVDVASADVIVDSCHVDYPAMLDAAVKARFSAVPDPDGGIRATLEEVRVTSRLLVAEGKGLVTRLPPLRADFDANQIEITGELGLTDVDATRIADHLGVPSYGSAHATGHVVAGGTIGDLDVTLRLMARNAVLLPPGGEEIRFGELSIVASHDAGTFALEQLFAGTGEWGLAAWGSLAWDPFVDSVDEIGNAPLEGRITLVNVPISVAGAIPGLAQARGSVDATINVDGTVSKPGARGTIDVVADHLVPEDDRIPTVERLALGLSLSDAGLEGVHVALRPSSARVLDARLSLESGGATVSFVPFRIDNPALVAKIEALDASRLGERYGTQEVIAGAVDIDVRVVDGPEVDVTVRGKGIRLETAERYHDDTSGGDVELKAHWGAEGLTARTTAFRYAGGDLEVNAQIPVSPSLHPIGIVRRDDEPVQIVVSGTDLPLAALSGSQPRLRVGGRADVRAVLDGPLGKPRGHAKVAIRDGFTRYPGAPSFDGIDGELEIRPGGVVHVKRLTALLGRGRLDVEPMEVEGVKPEDVPVAWLVRDGRSVALGRTNLRVHGENALFVRTRTTLVRGSPNLTLTGGGEKPRLLSGVLLLSSVRYTQRIDLISRRPSLAPLPLTADPFLTSLNLDVRVEAPRESIRVRNNLLDAEFGGRLRVLGTVALPRPEGRIISDRGSVKLPTVTMKLVRGVASFRRERPLQPDLDALLAASISRITVNVAAEGPIDNLEITTRSIPSMPEEDVITLLATGQVPEEVEGGTAATVAATLLYRQILSEMEDPDDDSEPSTIEDLASRVEEISVDTASLLGGGTPTWRATLRLDGEWLYLRGDQTDSFNYGLDLLFRLTFR